jgi:hypothetical protein
LKLLSGGTETTQQLFMAPFLSLTLQIRCSKIEMRPDLAGLY